MAEAVVDLGDGREPLRIRLDGKDATFRLRAHRIPAALVRAIEPRLQDLLDIAVCVFAADSSVKRGGDTGPGMGEGWRRNFEFHILVRDPAFWSRPEVIAALTDGVTFLTNDIVSFSFCVAIDALPAQPLLKFDLRAAAFAADEVLLFSGGSTPSPVRSRRCPRARPASSWSRIACRRGYKAPEGTSTI